MSHMSNLDLSIREAGINPESLDTLEEVIDLLRSHEISKALDQDCAECEVPELGIQHFVEDEMVTHIVHCGHRCRLSMPEHIAAELLGMEDSYDG